MNCGGGGLITIDYQTHCFGIVLSHILSAKSIVTQGDSLLAHEDVDQRLVRWTENRSFFCTGTVCVRDCTNSHFKYCVTKPLYNDLDAALSILTRRFFFHAFWINVEPRCILVRLQIASRGDFEFMHDPWTLL